MADGRQNLRLDEFTAKVVPDPKNPGKALCLTGFLGAASEPDQTRVYWDPSLTSYVDIANADILHSEPLPAEQSPLGGSFLWVSSSAEVTTVSSGGQSNKGKFFEGPLMSTYGAGFGQAAGTVGVVAGYTPTAAASYARGCWFSFDACPTMFSCGPHRTPGCPMVAQTPGVEAAPTAGIEAPVIGGSYARGCWYSFDACPTMFGCGPHRTPGCPMVAQTPGAAAAPAAGVEAPIIGGSYARGCWYSFDACPTMFGCGPHRTPGCPMVAQTPGAGAAPAAAIEAPVIGGSYARGCWYSFDACPTMFGCGPHRTPGCPMVAQTPGAGAAPAAVFEAPVVAGSYARGCWYSFDACPTMFGCGPHRTPACPI
jgi:hypothetical protein